MIDTRKLTAKAAKQGMVEPVGFVPTEWMPMSMAFVPSASGGKLYVATAKGKGTGPNNFPQQQTEETDGEASPAGPRPILRRCCTGRWRRWMQAEIEKNLPQWTAMVLESNRMKAAAGEDRVCRRSDKTGSST